MWNSHTHGGIPEYGGIPPIPPCGGVTIIRKAIQPTIFMSTRKYLTGFYFSQNSCKKLPIVTISY
jgi:hypothetical protein